jgi:hypothetical protein
MCLHSGGSISFSGAIAALATGVSYQSVAISDLDSDGRPDVLMGGNGNGYNYFGVFRNTSIGGVLSFGSINTFTTQYYSQALAVGDIDGDGKPDVVTAHLGGGNNPNYYNICLVRNTSTGPGNISFAGNVPFNSGNHQSTGLSLGDFNGDGKLDIATSNRPNGAVVMVRPNTAVSGTIDSNSLGAYVQLSTAGSYAEAVAIGDINGDGKPDIVSAADNNGSSPAVISVFKNTTTSTLIGFAAYDTYTEATGNSRSEINDVQLADLNNDGLLDVVRTNYNSNNISIFRNVQIVPPVYIVDFTPKQGPISTTVTITGGGFSANPLSNTVFFGCYSRYGSGRFHEYYLACYRTVWCQLSVYLGNEYGHETNGLFA